MISGESVTVRSFTSSGVDSMGEPVRTATTATVKGVLVVPSSTSDNAGSTRADGIKAAYTLHFPKTYTASLEGCEVDVRGETYQIVGDPRPYTASNCPTKWNRQAEAVRVDG